jgi:hypothetical protein
VLVVGLLSVLVFRFGISARQAIMLGIRFENFDPNVFETGLILVLLFLFVDFFFGAITDLVIKFDQVGNVAELDASQSTRRSEDQVAHARAYVAHFWLKKYRNMAYVAAFIRLSFDLLVPIVITTYAVVVFMT